jgi:FkbM family methyltransferase
LKSYFSISEKQSLFSKRLQRIRNFSRIPYPMLARLLLMYAKKIAGIAGSERDKQENYYFLSLINCDSDSSRIGKEEYEFKTRSGIRLLARKEPSSDLEVCNQVWGRREYQLATDLVGKNPSGERLTIVDAGANVGYTSLFFFRNLPGSKIYSIEPDEGNFSMMRRMIDLNNAGDDIIPLKFGIWSHRCNLKVDRSFRDNREWSIRVEEADTDTGLEGANLLDIITDHGIEKIDLCKIDIEGAERYLFADEANAASWLSKVRILAIEIHDEYVARDHLYGILRANGFTWFEFNDLTIANKA